jgi:hypothetical protein
MVISERIAEIRLREMTARPCLGPSTPLPAHQTTVRKKMPAAPVGMTVMEMGASAEMSLTMRSFGAQTARPSG